MSTQIHHLLSHRQNRPKVLINKAGEEKHMVNIIMRWDDCLCLQKIIVDGT